ncbi:MAG TPA: radical SAM protein [Thermodesulfobacteriota bacterium]
MKDGSGQTGAFSRSYASMAIKRRYPLSVTMISTYRCNFMCAYCDIWRLKEDELSTSQALGMIDEFLSMGMRMLRFDGGEPLLRGDIGELISYAKAKGVFTALATNGSLIEKNLRKLSGLDRLVVSLGGPADVHERQRMEGSYWQVLAGIRSARGAGLDVKVNVVLTKGNIAYLPEMAQDAARLGVTMTFEPLHAFAHASNRHNIKALSPGPAEYREAMGVLELLRKRGAPVAVNRAVEKKECSCRESSCAVTPAGDVAPCEHLFYERKWPNGLSMGFIEAFNAMRGIACHGPCTVFPEKDSA